MLCAGWSGLCAVLCILCAVFYVFTAGKSVTKIRNRMFEEGYSYVTGVREDSCGFVTKVLTADKTL
jgi:hypothetical protein